MGNDIVLFMDGNIQLEVPVSRDGESVWLSANQMAVLFDKDETNIRKHINNVFRSSEVESSRRKFLLMRNFRPLTPPCVPFGTRRFNQLNM